MKINNKPITSILILFLLISCKASPTIDFHSYQELSEYNFIDNGWFPEILSDDASNIQETYDIVNQHLFGKFEYNDRGRYDSLIGTYPKIASDSLLILIDKIEKPLCPDWFIAKECINNDKFVLAKHDAFYLIMEKASNRIYFLR